MKFYDKNLTPASENIKQAILVLIIFIIGFVVGFFIGGYDKQEKNKNQITNHIVSTVNYRENVSA